MTEKIYAKYKVCGVNILNLINRLNKKGITLLKIKKFSAKSIGFCLPINQTEKFFAILNDLCYNGINDSQTNRITVKNPKKKGKKPKRPCFYRHSPVFEGGGYVVYKIGEGGLFYPIRFLQTNLAVLIGAILFTFGVWGFNDVVLDVRYSGTASCLKQQVQTYLSQKGVGKWSRFSSLDLDELGVELTSLDSRIAFAQAYKRGNVLNIELVLSKTPPNKLDQSVVALYSDCQGVITDIKVYRGTAVVSVGDKVNVGDLLVDGYCQIKDNITPCTVLASVTINCDYIKSVCLNGQSDQRLAELLVLGELEDKNVINITTQKTPTEKGFLYVVHAVYSVTVTAG